MAVQPALAWDFTLADLAGERFVTLSRIQGPVLVNFWGRDCPPCVAELPRLQAFAQANPQWTVLLVSTDGPLDAQRFLAQRGITLKALRGGLAVGGLMRAAGNRWAGLPYSAAVQGGALCRRHLGELHEASLQALTQTACDATQIHGIPL
ncbi:outer membrane receptor for ferrienterochelin and colicins [Paucibacter oligotrophus]|uniref:Outer membrane receptor for ferrienterochelin and colicins n=1 Tax=Roseateles oligotrophus TaxID=1769250 RepID=A0A840L4D6_9BURK|nr:TlpA disulfide reductase family protein [Roseateles oligotrophus]MBB4842661.1 outer membrane receptor for ferrienterochelin and colicins [Roseateles oligotrophus]